MKKNFIYSLLIIVSIFIITGCNSKKIDTEYSRKEINSMKVIIDDREYIVNLENNETVKKFIDLLPLEIKMDELNGNEKYFYLNSELPTDSYNPKHIFAGDVMVYGNDCLVIFYKSFDTSYSYTKIGHIIDLPELGNSSVSVKFEKDW